MSNRNSFQCSTRSTTHLSLKRLSVLFFVVVPGYEFASTPEFTESSIRFTFSEQDVDGVTTVRPYCRPQQVQHLEVFTTLLRSTPYKLSTFSSLLRELEKDEYVLIFFSLWCVRDTESIVVPLVCRGQSQEHVHTQASRG
jgi:hypothetical protein